VICPGTNAFIHEDRVDGNWVTTCPACKTPRLTHATPWPSYRTVEAHTVRTG